MNNGTRIDKTVLRRSTRFQNNENLQNYIYCSNKDSNEVLNSRNEIVNEYFMLFSRTANIK